MSYVVSAPSWKGCVAALYRSLIVFDCIIWHTLRIVYQQRLRYWVRYHVQRYQWDGGIVDSLLQELSSTLRHWSVERRQILCDIHCNS